MSPSTRMKPLTFRGATTRFSDIRHGDGQITLYETVSPPGWSGLKPVQGRTDAGLMKELLRLFKVNILPGKKLERTLVLFTIPDGFPDPFPETTSIGHIPDQDRRVKYWLTRLFDEGELLLEGSELKFANTEYQKFWNALVASGLTVMPSISEGGGGLFLPVYRNLCTLSQHAKGLITCNSLYFQMEITDCATAWDIMGNPIGFFVAGAEILLPPLFGREALFVGKDGSSRIEKPSLSELSACVGKDEYRDGFNCEFLSRPDVERTPAGSCVELVVVGRKIVGVCSGGGTEIPEGGFVIRTKAGTKPADFDVVYRGYEDLAFAAQAGPALVAGGVPAKGFGSPFWAGAGPAFPPTVYPLDWQGGRAARLALGARDGKPVIIWVEGASKLSYLPGMDSCGASLAELAQICADEGAENMLNLDGGGSAQICIDGRRRLRLSDRRPELGCHAERPVPLGISFNLDS